MKMKKEERDVVIRRKREPDKKAKYKTQDRCKPTGESYYLWVTIAKTGLVLSPFKVVQKKGEHLQGSC
jgi:hypothetical protein